MSLKRPLPRPSRETETFWHGLRQRKLMLQSCHDCGRYQYYPRVLCRHCQSRSLRWEEVEPRGTLYSYSVVHRAPTEFSDDLPFITAVVELTSGPRVFARLVNIDPSDVKVGMRVAVAWPTNADEAAIFNFEPEDRVHA